MPTDTEIRERARQLLTGRFAGPEQRAQLQAALDEMYAATIKHLERGFEIFIPSLDGTIGEAHTADEVSQGDPMLGHPLTLRGKSVDSATWG